MRRTVLWAALVASVATLAAPSTGASTTYTHGYDISWPQCSGPTESRVPAGAPAYVVLGLTHGRGRTTNPCLPAQLAWAEQQHVAVGAYLVPSFPSRRELAADSTGAFGACGGDRTCRLRNDGASQAADALSVLTDTGAPAPMVWVDVEFRQVQPWSHAHPDNVHLLEGVFDRLHAAGMPFGVYTTSYMWRSITGGWRMPVPNWVPGGGGNPGDAKRMCATTATGGATWLVQYTRSYDEDLTCPVMDATPGRRGPLWPYRTTVLQLGSAGAAVRALQRALGAQQPSGDYDVGTLALVAEFQATHGLPPDGRVDSDDWRALGAFTLRGGHPFLLSRLARVAR